MPAEQRVRHLIEEIDTYLGALAGDGVSQVRTGIARWKDGAFAACDPAKTALPDELCAALELLHGDGHATLSNAIAAASDNLNWITYDLYPRHEIGEAFASGHSYCSIMGDGSPIAATDFYLGLFIIKPNTLYRDHKHKAPELYAPLTGPHGWRFAKGDPLTWKPAHLPVWNEPYQHHATKTGPNPFLCIFGWVRDTQEAATVIPCDDWQKLEEEMPVERHASFSEVNF
jgi:Dimethlysulfonioproprionate lyase